MGGWRLGGLRVGRTLSSGLHQQETMDKGLPPVTQLLFSEPSRIRHTTAEWDTARGSQYPTSTGGQEQGREDEPE